MFCFNVSSYNVILTTVILQICSPDKICHTSPSVTRVRVRLGLELKFKQRLGLDLGLVLGLGLRSDKCQGQRRI